MVTSLYCETIGYGVSFDSTLIPVKVLCTLYTMWLLVSLLHLQRVALMVMGKSWSVSNIAGGHWQHCHFWEGVLVLEGSNLARLIASSSDDVGRCVLSNCLLRAKNLAFLGLVSQSLSSELPLVVPLAISDLALGRLGNALLLGGGGSGVEVFRIWLIHLSLLTASCCCSCRNLLVTALLCWSLTA